MLAGVKLSTRGATVKVPELDSEPALTVTLMTPVSASAGTMTRICVVLGGSNEAEVGEFPNFTCDAVLSSVPVMVTVVPGPPEVGEKPVMLGSA